MDIPISVWVILVCWTGFYGCESSPGSRKFGDALIRADIRYLQHNGELTGTWSFFQRNQKDSLIPDAQRHDFVINGQKAQSEKVKNNYHMYLVADTFVSRNLNVQIGPDNLVFTLEIPDVPEIRPDTLDPSLDWVMEWDGDRYGAGDSVTLVVTGPESHTVMGKAAAASGEMTIPVTHMFSLRPGGGFYYLISSSHQIKDMDGIDLEYRMEVYSDDFSLEILGEDRE